MRADMAKLQEYAKAIVALTGAVTILVTTVVDGLADVAQTVTAVTAALTAAGVYQVPNRQPDIQS